LNILCRKDATFREESLEAIRTEGNFARISKFTINHGDQCRRFD